MISTSLIEDKKAWEEFVIAYEENSEKPLGGIFLESWAWGEFQKKLGREIHRLGVYEGKRLVGVSILCLQKAKTGSFIYVPAGPIFLKWDKKLFTKWLEFTTNLAREKEATFLRIEPRVVSTVADKLLKEAGFVKAAAYTQPKCTAVIDLAKTEDELLAAASDSTRYNIRASVRKGVNVREGSDKEIQIFVNLLKETAQRKSLTLPIEKDYHKIQFDNLHQEGFMKLFIAEAEREALSAVLVLFYGNSAYYLHAANSLRKKELRVSYPLVWHCILEGKKKGLKWFDFWGASQSEDPNDPWAGVTGFKLSFGAQRVCFDSVYDLPLKNSYLLTKAVETWRKPIRKIAKAVFSPGSKIRRIGRG